MAYRPGAGRVLVWPSLLIGCTGLLSLPGCNAPKGAAPRAVAAAATVAPATRPGEKSDFFANQAVSQAREDAQQVQVGTPAGPPLPPPPNPIQPAPRPAPVPRW